MKKSTGEPLPFRERLRLRHIIDVDGLEAVVKATGASRAAIQNAATGEPILRGTRHLINQAYGKMIDMAICDWCGVTDDRDDDAELPPGWEPIYDADLCPTCFTAREKAIDVVRAERKKVRP